MGSFPRIPRGYDPEQVDERLEELERELSYLSGMLVDRERELRLARGELRELRSRGEESVTAIEAVGRQLEEIQAQARSQATRIRMKALKEAAEIGERVSELAKRVGLDPGILLEFRRQSRVLEDALDPEDEGHAVPGDGAPERFDGAVEVEIGPLADFSQLAQFEDAAQEIGAVEEVAVKRFSQGRATLAIQLEEPVDLPGELQRRAPFGFSVREASGERIVLDAADGLAEAA